MTKPSRKQICFCLERVQMALTPPWYFCNPLRNFFLFYLRQTKVPPNAWILVILPHFPWTMSKPKKKRSSKYLYFGHPPPSLENSKLKQKSSSNCLDMGENPPSPLHQKFPNTNHNRKFLKKLIFRMTTPFELFQQQKNRFLLSDGFPKGSRKKNQL